MKSRFIAFVILLNIYVCIVWGNSKQPILKGTSCFAVYNINFSNDGRFLIINGEDESKIWDLSKKKFYTYYISPYRYHTYGIDFIGESMILSSKNFLITGKKRAHCDFFSESICKVQIMSFNLLNDISELNRVIFNNVSYYVSEDEKIFLLEEGIGRVDVIEVIIIYNRGAKYKITSIKPGKSVPYKAKLDPNSKHIAIWSKHSKDQKVTIYKIEEDTSTILTSIKSKHLFYDVYMSNNGEYLIIDGVDNIITCYNKHGEKLWEIKKYLYKVDLERKKLYVKGKRNDEMYILSLDRYGNIIKREKYDSGLIRVLTNGIVSYGKPIMKHKERSIVVHYKTKRGKLYQFHFKGLVTDVEENKKGDIAIASLDGTVGIKTKANEIYYINPKFSRIVSTFYHYKGCACPPCPEWYLNYRKSDYNKE